MVYDYGYQPAPSHITTILIILGLLKNRGTPQINHDLALKPMVTWGSPLYEPPKKINPYIVLFLRRRATRHARFVPSAYISVMSGHVRVSSGGCPRPAL